MRDGVVAVPCPADVACVLARPVDAQDQRDGADDVNSREDVVPKELVVGTVVVDEGPNPGSLQRDFWKGWKRVLKVGAKRISNRSRGLAHSLQEEEKESLAGKLLGDSPCSPLSCPQVSALLVACSKRYKSFKIEMETQTVEAPVLETGLDPGGS